MGFWERLLAELEQEVPESILHGGPERETGKGQPLHPPAELWFGRGIFLPENPSSFQVYTDGKEWGTDQIGGNDKENLEN